MTLVAGMNTFPLFFSFPLALLPTRSAKWTSGVKRSARVDLQRDSRLMSYFRLLLFLFLQQKVVCSPHTKPPVFILLLQVLMKVSPWRIITFRQDTERETNTHTHIYPTHHPNRLPSSVCMRACVSGYPWLFNLHNNTRGGKWLHCSHSCQPHCSDCINLHE